MTFSFLNATKTRILFALLLASLMPGLAGGLVGAGPDPTFEIEIFDDRGAGATNSPIDPDLEGGLLFDQDRIEEGFTLIFTEIATGEYIRITVDGNYIQIDTKDSLGNGTLPFLGLQASGDGSQVEAAGFEYFSSNDILLDEDAVALTEPLSVVADTFEDIPVYAASIRSEAFFQALSDAAIQETYTTTGIAFTNCHRTVIDGMPFLVDFLFEDGSDLDVVNALNDLYLAMEDYQNACDTPPPFGR
ncbi:hypothetical protein SCOR_01225 [Sulfidibacter corallicola]|uniref:Uncharacterized protein n=1 Tax=Sulfidibacter corallicola TaxID=2818388 RepID=A0A8A4TI69_SULCO|nr:hypothetical protein [Sulfidibacter corallicola]QTD48852.1 hypothetical protein J3U87_24990 [Sulfidibacter corallicola]